ncbi:hypothetical protein YC2023_090914 [Brassica napus]
MLDQVSVMVRTMIEIKVSKNALRMFYALVYKLDHELLKVGFAFHFQRTAHISEHITLDGGLFKIRSESKELETRKSQTQLVSSL